MEYNSLGEKINFTDGPDWLTVKGGGCAVCHGLDGTGGKQVQNCTATPPGIRNQELSGNYLNNDTLIARAITQGIDENGEELDFCMPRWHLEQNDLKYGNQQNIVSLILGAHEHTKAICTLK